jgi:DNA invertase Pin-like site-specific DNA recombinase
MKSRARQQPATKPARGRAAVMYVRVSSKEQEQGFSIPAQRQLLTEYADREGLHVLQEFEDVETAKRAGRTSFGEMVAFLRQTSPPCRILLVEKTDRLYRNIKDWVTIDDLGIEVHFVKEGVVLSDDSRSSEKFMHGIKVLMAKNYIDNLGEEVRKGMIEKARQGHWPSFAPIGYVNSPVTRRIEPDPERAPMIAQLFEWYASGESSLKELTRKAAAAGLTNRSSGRPLARSKLHQLLQNPIYCGDFQWLGQSYQGQHKPLISRELYQRVQDVFTAANHPRHTKQGHAFAGMVTCGRCGCAFTAEIKKGRYVYYHCTGHRGACGNTYVREEELIRQFGEILKQVRVPTELAGKLATILRESQSDKEKFVRTAMLRLQQQQMLLRSKLDRAYDDRLSRQIPEELWSTKSAELQEELRRVRAEMERHEHASEAYEATGLQILELAQTAYSSYVTENPHEQARLVKTLVSNCSFDRGSLSPTYVKPFDVFAKGAETGDWLLRLDSNQQPSG